MSGEHVGLTLVMAGMLLTLAVYSFRARPGSRGSQIARRAFWAAALLLFSGALGGPGWTVFNWAATAFMGLPGYGAAAALSLIAP